MSSLRYRSRVINACIHRWHCLVVCVFGLAVSVTTDAQTPPPATPPVATPMTWRIGPEVMPSDRSKNAGFVCEVALDSTGGPGYDQVHCHVSLPTASPVQRRLSLRLETIPEQTAPSRNGLKVELPMVIEQGAIQAELTRCVPRWVYGNRYLVRLEEDSVLLDGYETVIGNVVTDPRMTYTHSYWDEAFLRWLIIDDAGQPTDLPEHWSYVTIEANGNRNEDAVQSPLLVIKPQDIPEDWRILQSIDGLVIDVAVLNTLREKQPLAWQSIRAWILLGGTLVVRRANSTLDLARLCGQRNMSDAETQSHAAVSAVFKEATNSAVLYRRSLENLRNNYYGIRQYQQAHEAKYDARLAQIDVLQADISLGEDVWKQNVCVIRMGTGRAIGFAELSHESAMHWYCANQLVSGWRSTAIRRGVSPLIGDKRSQRWLIPGVAQPPVYTFMGLLTVFVLLVGPLAYRQTTRSGRGYLMFIIAPVLALMTTVAMFVYGILSDGFGSVTRIRQITWIDSESQDAVSRSRGSYFAGIRPSSRLRFSADAEVLLYPDAPTENIYEYFSRSVPPIGDVRIDDQIQTFSTSLVPSRQQKQFVVHQALPNYGRIRLTRDSNQAVPELSNETKLDLSQLTVRDHNGDFWICDRIQAGQTVQLISPFNDIEVGKRQGDLFNKQRLVEQGVSNRFRNLNYGEDLIEVISRDYFQGGESAIDGALEFWLRERFQLGKQLPPSHFFAETSIDPQSIAVDGAVQVDCIHFVIGTIE